MMDAYEQEKLFREMVVDKIEHTTDGLVILPLGAMQDFHDQIGLTDDEPCLVAVSLPEAEEEYFNYYIGADCDEEAYLEAIDVSFYDGETDMVESIQGGPLLYGAILRDFLGGMMPLCGQILVDQKGRMWMHGNLSEDISVDLRVTVKAGSMGYSFYSEDMGHTIRMWRDEEHFYYAPTTIFYTDGLPS